MIDRQAYKMSTTLSRLVNDTLLAKFFIHPVPNSLSQSMAIYSYFAGLSQYPMIQYRHARDASTGNKTTSFRVMYKDPLPEINSQTSQFLIESSSSKGADESLDTQNVKHTSYLKAHGERDLSNDHSDRTNVWKNSRMTVLQKPFYDRLKLFSDEMKKQYTNEDKIDFMDETKIRELWSRASEYYFPAAGGMASSREAAITNAISPKNASSKPVVHLTTITKQESSVVDNNNEIIVSPLEHSLLETSHLIVDNESHTVIPFETFFKEFHSGQRLINVLEQDKMGFGNEFDQRYTHFELSLKFMTRDPDVVTFAADVSLLDKLRIPRSDSNTSSSSVPIDLEKRSRALERLRLQVLNGFTGSLEFRD